MGPIRSYFTGSIAARWVSSITAVAGMGIAALLLVTHIEMNYQVDAQGAAANRLARLKTGERIDSEIELVTQRIRTMFDSYESAMLGVARLRTSIVAATSGNDVAIAEEIGQRLVRAGLSGAVVIDVRRNVIGSERTGAELVAANQALKLHDIYGMLGDILAKNDRAHPRTYRYVGPLDASFSTILLSPVQDRYGAVFAVPIFDEFGDTIALILGHRTLKAAEEKVTEFARITGATVALMLGDEAITVAGADIDQIALQTPESDGFRAVPTLQAAARCQKGLPWLEVCVIRPNSEIARYGEELMAIGRAQFAQAQKALAGLGVVAIGLILAILILLARRLTRPLSEITQAVDRVANGEWRVEVLHTEREDEIGRIARAVSAMQLSLSERDRMRQELVRIDAINQRRLVLDTAVARLEDGMAIVMKNINGTLHALAETNDALDDAARRADSQAEKIRDASVVTADHASMASRITEELVRTNHEIAVRAHCTSEVVHRSESHAQKAEAKLGQMAAIAGKVESRIGALQGLIADLGHATLKASLEALEVGGESHGYAPLSRSIGDLAETAGKAADVVAREFARIGVMADGAVGELGQVKGVLGEALREAEEISVAVGEQEAAAREIADGLSGSADALSSLAEAVDQLRASMSSAHEASNDFVLTARRIVEDAKVIDESIRAFVREVVA